jgi:hypothetical protein
MIFRYNTYSDFVKEYNNYHFHECSNCHNSRELIVQDVNITIEDRTMHFKGLIIMTCTKCGSCCLPQHSKQMIDGCYKIMLDEGHFEGIQTYRGYKKNSIIA